MAISDKFMDKLVEEDKKNPIIPDPAHQDKLAAVKEQEESDETDPKDEKAEGDKVAEKKMETVIYEEEIEVPPEPKEPEEKEPQPVKLEADTLVTDPRDGKDKKFSEVDDEREMRADYTRKTQALAEERKELEAQLATRETPEKIVAEKDDLGELDQTDPVVAELMRIRLQQENLERKNAALEANLEERDQVADRKEISTIEKELLKGNPILGQVKGFSADEIFRTCASTALAIQKPNEKDTDVYKRVVLEKVEALKALKLSGEMDFKERSRKQPKTSLEDNAVPPLGKPPPKLRVGTGDIPAMLAEEERLAAAGK